MAEWPSVSAAGEGKRTPSRGPWRCSAPSRRRRRTEKGLTAQARPRAPRVYCKGPAGVTSGRGPRRIDDRTVLATDALVASAGPAYDGNDAPKAFPRTR